MSLDLINTPELTMTPLRPLVGVEFPNLEWLHLRQIGTDTAVLALLDFLEIWRSLLPGAHKQLQHLSVGNLLDLSAVPQTDQIISLQHLTESPSLILHSRTKSEFRTAPWPHKALYAHSFAMVEAATGRPYATWDIPLQVACKHTLHHLVSSSIGGYLTPVQSDTWILKRCPLADPIHTIHYGHFAEANFLPNDVSCPFPDHTSSSGASACLCKLFAIVKPIAT
jgi:hypothetical protein